MTPERWQRIEQVLEAALERGGAERTALLDRECAGDPGLREEVESLLASAAAQSFVLSPPGLLRATEPRSPRLCARTTECFTLTLGALPPQVLAQMTAPRGSTQSSSPTAVRPTRPPVSLGADVTLRGGRALHLQLTPTPTQCAPLLSLRY